jgi:hypothetical protein
VGCEEKSWTCAEEFLRTVLCVIPLNVRTRRVPSSQPAASPRVAAEERACGRAADAQATTAPTSSRLLVLPFCDRLSLKNPLCLSLVVLCSCVLLVVNCIVEQLRVQCGKQELIDLHIQAPRRGREKNV